jgi:hypothetical protein
MYFKCRKLVISVIITVLLVISVPCFAAQASRFTDVTNEDWFFDEVMELYGKGIINGYDDETYRPYSYVKTDEFIKLTVTALGYTVSNAEEYWASGYIEKADTLGLLYGLEVTDYTKPITRGEAAVIIANALTARGEEDVPYSGMYPFDLGAYTPYEYLSAIKKGFEKGIITGYEDFTYRYSENILRSECSALIIRLISPVERKTDTAMQYDGILHNPSEKITYVNVTDDELSAVIKNTVNEIKDRTGVTYVEKKVYETKTVYEIQYYKSLPYSGNPAYSMFIFRFFDGNTGYPETQWGYDTMFLKVEIRALDWQDEIPLSFYKSKIKNALCCVLHGNSPQPVSDYMIKWYDSIRSMKTEKAYNITEDNNNDTLRYVFFTMQNTVCNYTFSYR